MGPQGGTQGQLSPRLHQGRRFHGVLGRAAKQKQYQALRIRGHNITVTPGMARQQGVKMGYVRQQRYVYLVRSRQRPR